MKKVIAFSGIVILCIIVAVILIFTMPRLENRTWILSYAQQAEAPYFVVAHNTAYDFSDDEIDTAISAYKDLCVLIDMEITQNKLLERLANLKEKTHTPEK